MHESAGRLIAPPALICLIKQGVLRHVPQNSHGGSQDRSDNVYPAAGAGIQYILKPKEGVVLNLEYALGKSDQYGFYLKTGYAY